MEGKNTALLTLLILIQFAEMKSAVLKELSQDKLWAICYNGVPPLPICYLSFVLIDCKHRYRGAFPVAGVACASLLL